MVQILKMHHLMLLGLLAILVSPGECQCPATCVAPRDSYAFLSADQSQDFLYLAGIFGIHEGDGLNCGELRSRGIQNLEAFLWAVSTFKTRYVNALQDISLGAIGFDSCGSSDKIVQQVLNLDGCQVGYGTSAIVDPARVFGFVGPDRSAQAAAITPLFKEMERTIVSHAATSDTLNTGTTNPYLLRSVPSDGEQVNALVAIIKELGWKYVQTVHSANSYGKDGIASFNTLASQEDICVVNSEIIPERPTQSQMDLVMDGLMDNPQTTVVVVFANDIYARELLLAASRADARGQFTWIGTNSWGKSLEVVKGVESIAEGAITVTLEDDVDAAFTEELRTKDTSTTNPWFEEYLRQLNVATLDNIDIDSYVPYTIFAIDAILNGIEEARKDKCGDSGLCNSFLADDAKWAIIHDAILDVQTPIRFNQTSGDTLSGQHAIYNFRGAHGNCPDHCYARAGSYERAGNDVDLKNSDIYFYDSDGERVRNKRDSQCGSVPCVQCGETAPTTTTAQATTPVVNGGENQQDVRETGPPSKLREGTWVIVLIVLAGLGIALVVIFEIYLMVKLSGSEVFSHWKAMWLGQLLLFGIFLCYLTLFAFVPSPTKAACGIIRFGVGGSYSMCFAVLLVKLMIILSSERVGNLQGTYQFFMFLFAWGVQVAVDIEWLILEHPGAYYSDDTANGWTCNTDLEAHVKSLVYVMFLIVMCTILSMKAHGLVANHRESIFIGLATGFTIPVWVVWILIGLLKNNPEYHDPCLAFGLFITATLLLFIMFLPKVRQLSRGVDQAFYEEDLADGIPSIIHGGGSLLHVDPHGSIAAGSLIHSKPEPMVLAPTSAVTGAEPESVILVPNGGVYAQPNVMQTLDVKMDPSALHLKHPGTHSNTLRAESVHSLPISRMGSRPPQTSIYATNPRVLHVTKDLTGQSNPSLNRRTTSELNYNVYYGPAKSATRSVGAASSRSGTLKKARSIQDLGSL